MSKRAIEQWKRLQVVGAGDGVIEVPSIDSNIATGFGTARYSLGAQGQPRLLIPIGGFLTKDLVSTPNLSITTSVFNISGKSVVFIDLMCRESSLDVIFAELAEEILQRIKNGSASVKAVTESIDDFRSLLKEGSSNDVQYSKILGLVGELEVLRRLASCKASSALDAWTGPSGLRHDFRRSKHALEVKTSSRSDASRIKVNGIDQLSAPEGGTLHLAHVRLENSACGGLSIGKLVDVLVDIGVGKSILLEKLELLGCADPYSIEWNRLCFTLEDISFYSVEDGFPRLVNSCLVSGGVPLGVSSIEYQFDINYASSFRLSPVEIEILLKRISG